MLEKEIERKLSELVKSMGGTSYKWVAPGQSGVPDRIVLLPGGRTIFVELKADGGELSLQQVRQCNRIADLGMDVRVIWGMAGVAAFLSIYDETTHRLNRMMETYKLSYKQVGEAEIKSRCFIDSKKIGGDAK